MADESNQVQQPGGGAQPGGSQGQQAPGRNPLEDKSAGGQGVGQGDDREGGAQQDDKFGGHKTNQEQTRR